MRLRTTCKSEILARTWRDWPVCWPGDLDVRDEFRNGVFPIDFRQFSVSQLWIFIFIGIVTRFWNKERSVGVRNSGKLACFEEFVLEEVNVSNVGENFAGCRIEYTELCVSVIT